MKQAIKALLLLFVLFLSLSIVTGIEDPEADAKLAACLKDCDATFGAESANRGLEEPSADILEKCSSSRALTYGDSPRLRLYAGRTTKMIYADFVSCKEEAVSYLKRSEEECKFYLKVPSYETAEQNYNLCINEAKNTQKFQNQVCVEIYLDACYFPCTDRCSIEKEESQELVCIDSTCTSVKKGTAPAGAAKEDCSGKSEGSHCGYYIACIGNMCKTTKKATKTQVGLCADKNIGYDCCEPPYYGKVLLIPGVIKKEVEVVESNWTTLTCKWNYYEWERLVPYDKTTCTYNQENAREIRLFRESGISKGIYGFFNCGPHTKELSGEEKRKWEDYLERLNEGISGAGSVKG